jgi:hypothetical protein
LRFAVHQALGVDVVARPAAFDHVTCQSEGSPAKSDDGNLINEMIRYKPHRLGHIAEFRSGIGSQSRNVLRGSQRLVDNRAFTGRELERQAHDFQG